VQKLEFALAEIRRARSRRLIDGIAAIALFA
jgi:hypothetical protein